jgi:hypothetical protein
MPVSDFLDLMPDTVTYQAVTSRDIYGKPSYGAASSYRARVIYKTMRTTSMTSGQEVLAAGCVWLAATLAPPDIDDRITLPNGGLPKILNYERFTDEGGVHHTKVLFGGTGFGGQK